MSGAAVKTQPPPHEGENQQPHSPLAIANEFLKRAKRDGKELTHMQLQKLVYIANGWLLAASERPLVEDDPEAWEFGPVYRRLFDALKKYGRSPVNELIRWGDDTPFSLDDGDVAEENLAPDEQDIINMVWDAYGDMQAFQLSALTHQNGSPWSRTYKPRRNRRIPQHLIKEHFTELMERYGKETSNS